jgi:hypothetical protein
MAEGRYPEADDRQLELLAVDPMIGAVPHAGQHAEAECRHPRGRRPLRGHVRDQGSDGERQQRGAAADGVGGSDGLEGSDAKVVHLELQIVVTRRMGSIQGCRPAPLEIRGRGRAYRESRDASDSAQPRAQYANEPHSAL